MLRRLKILAGRNILSSEAQTNAQTIVVGVAGKYREKLGLLNPMNSFIYYSIKDFVHNMPEDLPVCFDNIIVNRNHNLPVLSGYVRDSGISIHDFNLSQKYPLSERTLIEAIDLSSVFAPETLVPVNITVLGSNAEEWFKYIEEQIGLGNRTDDFMAQFRSAVYNSYEFLSEKAFLSRLLVYVKYRWECEHMSSELIDFCQNIYDLLLEENLSINSSFYFTYASLLARIGMFQRMRKVLQNAPSKKSLENYLFLSSTVSPSGNGDENITKSAKLCSRLIENEKTFSRLVGEADGKVAIVGNGPQELGKGSGPEIDSANLVVRFNTFSTKYPHSQDYGTKTDVWVRMIPHPYVRYQAEPEGLSQVMITGANRLHRFYSNWEWIYKQIDVLPNLGFTPSRPFIELTKQLGNIPTSGLLLAYMTYKEIGPLPEGTVFGSSFVEGYNEKAVYHASDNHAAMSGRHDFDKEVAFFRSISGRKAISYYTPLSVFEKHSSIIMPGTTSPFIHEDLPLDIEVSPHLEPYVESAESKEEWTAINFVNSFDRIFTTSKGLMDYNIDGRPVEFCNKASSLPDDIERALVIGFGLRGTGKKAQNLERNYGVKAALAEYGLISGTSIPSKTKFKFSLLLDDQGIFFDTTRPSRTNTLLSESMFIGGEAVKARARKLIDLIVENDLVKYNDSPKIKLRKTNSPRKILVVDQTLGDLSIKLGQCEKYSFNDMLEHALKQNNARVYVKLHPETVYGVKEPNFDLDALRKNRRITILDMNCNMMNLVKQVDEVYVMTSGSGLEALMAGKKVTCFGAPFYAGWGLTEDMQIIAQRPRERTLEEIIAAVFLQQTLWFDPVTQESCTPEAALKGLLKIQKKL